MSKLRLRHVRILSTIGPSSANAETIARLADAGVDGFRLNFSHGDHKTHRKVVDMIRAVEEKTGHPFAIVQDLQGPKIRLGEMTAPQTLEIGATFILDLDATPGTAERCSLPHPEILGALRKGDRVYINDGLVRLRVVKTAEKSVQTEVMTGGAISSRKGVNLPGVDLPVSALTEKDIKDLEFGLTLGVDWVALSFVQNPGDVRELKARVQGRAAVMAKIEMPNAVQRINAILEESDGIMIARGDLGVEVPLEEVPSIQKRLIYKCRVAGKPVVVATQMLESMVNNALPTRAEVSDVANATYEGADTLMLSAETASGKYPVEAVETMDAIIRRVERSKAWRPLMDARRPQVQHSVGDAISHAAFEVVENLNACAVVTFTESGSTALRMSRQRPLQPIFALSSHISTLRRLSLSWGLHCRPADVPETIDDVINMAVAAVRRENICQDGQHIAITAGVPFGQSGTTNMVRVATL